MLVRESFPGRGRFGAAVFGFSSTGARRASCGAASPGRLACCARKRLRSPGTAHSTSGASRSDSAAMRSPVGYQKLIVRWWRAYDRCEPVVVLALSMMEESGAGVVARSWAGWQRARRWLMVHADYPLERDERDELDEQLAALPLIVSGALVGSQADRFEDESRRLASAWNAGNTRLTACATHTLHLAEGNADIRHGT
jgi:hypothetical protein